MPQTQKAFQAWLLIRTKARAPLLCRLDIPWFCQYPLSPMYTAPGSTSKFLNVSPIFSSVTFKSVHSRLSKSKPKWIRQLEGFLEMAAVAILREVRKDDRKALGRHRVLLRTHSIARRAKFLQENLVASSLLDLNYQN